MSRFSYPHTIENGAGERLTFLRREPGRAAGERLVVSNVVAPGAGPPMHVHHYQEESLTVVRGRMGYERAGEAPRFAGPGERVTFLAGETHRFWNAGSEDLEGIGYIEPADNVEYFLAELFASQRRGGGARPSPMDAAFLAWRYRSEFAIAEIPRAVQRVLFPLVVAVGGLAGRWARYADAPAPVQR